MTLIKNNKPYKCLYFRLDSLKEVHRARLAEHRRMEGDIENARCSAQNLEESSLELQLKFYRAMTMYVQNLVECLREKVRHQLFSLSSGENQGIFHAYS